jgi:hypothetical protein
VNYGADPKALINGKGVSRGMSPNLQNELKISVSKGVINGIKNEVSEAERVTLCAALRKLKTLGSFFSIWEEILFSLSRNCEDDSKFFSTVF